MIKTFVSLSILYALFVAVYLFWLNHSKKKKDIVGKSLSHQTSQQRKIDIVGKSKFNTPLKPTTTNTETDKATTEKSEKELENSNTFVSPSEVKQETAEDLDQLFEDDNEPMDIDFPLEYGIDEMMEYEDEEFEELEGITQVSFASGVQFEDLGNLVKTVFQTDQASLNEKLRAGDTLLDMQKTDLFEQVVSSKPDAKRIVSELMAESLAEFYRRKDAALEETTNKAPTDFDIRDFAS